MSSTLMVNASYLVAATCFIFGLKLLSHPSSARKGNLVSAVGMLIAVLVTLIDKQILSYEWIATGVLVGTIPGIWLAKRVEMTAMPELVSIFNGFGGLASLLLGVSSLTQSEGQIAAALSVLAYMAVIIGGVTFTGSIIAWLKLGEHMPTRAIVFPLQRWLYGVIILSVVVLAVFAAFNPGHLPYFYVAIGLALAFGILATLPIGGADMPVIISLFNALTGLAVGFEGYVLGNAAMIIAGIVVGSAGSLLTHLMAVAMNRSVANVFFAGVGTDSGATGEGTQGEMKEIQAQDAGILMAFANQVVIIPGYGMAVAQAQHKIWELTQLLNDKGVSVKFAIHPVAGRMPGHMNVLLAEAGVPYDMIYDMEDINADFKTTTVALVIGANDVVNPSAKTDTSSPLYGMPVLDAIDSDNVIVIKRGRGAGFSGVENPLFFADNTKMLFGDGQKAANQLIQAVKELS